MGYFYAKNRLSSYNVSDLSNREHLLFVFLCIHNTNLFKCVFLEKLSGPYFDADSKRILKYIKTVN